MIGGGHGQADRINSPDQLAEVSGEFRPQLLGDVSDRFVCIAYCDEASSIRARVDAHVLAAELPNAYYRDFDHIERGLA
jgi:hypothetical protein